MPTEVFSWRSPWRWLWLAPWAMLLLNLLSWLVQGSDLPFVDDWRAYADGTAGRWLPAHWFTAINNTMAPVGLALDALAQRVLAGNVLAYQFISQLLVQGGLLICQWRLLRWALPDVRLAVLAFTGTAFMLQAGSYWGEQNLAYHQALPLLWLLMAVCVGVSTALGPWLVGALAVLLGGLAGLSYISGAVAAGVLGLGLLLVQLWAKPVVGADGRRVGAAALGLLLAGGLTTGLQLWASRVLPDDVQGQAIPSAMPTEPAFWAYALGKLGRALGQGWGHGSESARWDVALVAAVWAVLLLALLAVAWLVLLRGAAVAQRRLMGDMARHNAVGVQRVALVGLPLAAMAAVYLLLVAHGRANFRDADVQGWLAVYQFGYLRFHFYWLTLVLPWGLAAAAVLLGWRAAGRAALHSPTGVATAQLGRGVVLGMGVITVGLLGLGAARSVFDVSSHYRSSTEFRNTQWACIHAQWGFGQPIACPTFDMPDATGALLQAHHLGTSFTRYLPMPLLPVDMGRELHRWQDGAVRTGAWHQVHWAEAGEWLQTEHDAQWQPDVRAVPGLAQALAQCRVLSVAVQMQGNGASRAQVFFQPQGAAGFSEAQSVAQAWGGAAQQSPQTLASSPALPLWATPLHTVHAVWESAQGFAPALRVDVSDRPMLARVASLRVSCRLPTLAAWQTAQPKAAERKENP